MTVQYRDGTFGETLPLSEAMEKFKDAVDAGTAKSLHVGTQEEIDQVKEEQIMKYKLSSINDRLKDLEAKNSSIIDAPTLNEIKKFAGEAK